MFVEPCAGCAASLKVTYPTSKQSHTHIESSLSPSSGFCSRSPLQQSHLQSIQQLNKSKANPDHGQCFSCWSVACSYFPPPLPTLSSYQKLPLSAVGVSPHILFTFCWTRRAHNLFWPRCPCDVLCALVLCVTMLLCSRVCVTGCVWLFVCVRVSVLLCVPHCWLSAPAR